MNYTVDKYFQGGWPELVLALHGKRTRVLTSVWTGGEQQIYSVPYLVPTHHVLYRMHVSPPH